MVRFAVWKSALGLYFVQRSVRESAMVGFAVEEWLCVLGLFCAAKLTRRLYGWLRCVGVGVLKSMFLFRGEDLAGISSVKSTNLSLYEDLTA